MNVSRHRHDRRLIDRAAGTEDDWPNSALAPSRGFQIFVLPTASILRELHHAKSVISRVRSALVPFVKAIIEVPINQLSN